MEEAITEIVAKPIEALASMAFKKINFAMSKELDSTIEQLGEIFCFINSTLQNVDPFEASSNIERMKIERLQLIHDELNLFFTKLGARTGVQGEVMGSRGFTSKACSFLSSPKQLVLRFKYAGKVNHLTSKLKSLASVNELCINMAIDPCGNQDRYTPSEDTSPFPVTDVFIGRHTDKENIINLLCNYSVVAIVGVGGQGKTTLAQHVCQDGRVKGSFDKLLWVYVTPQSTIIEILEKIIASATGKKPNYYGLQLLHEQVLQALLEKKCLLVLDNVSYVENLSDHSEALNAILKEGIFWGNGGKVLITTRSKEAAKLMNTPEPYELHDLAKDDSWKLLGHYAIKEQEDKKEFSVEEIGKEITKMCPKVPLVLKIIGRHLADKDYKSQWECFRNELASNPAVYMPKQHEKIKQILKLCYDQLDNNLKRCVAFCSLFPKGHKYHKKYMVHNWIALGFVESRDGMSLEDVGDAYVLELTNNAFFEKVGTFEFFKMHDVMHDLMLLIGKDKHQMIDSKTKNIVEGVRQVSLNMQDLNWNVLLSSISGKQTLESILLVQSAWGNCVHGERLRSGIDKLIPACQKLKVLEIYDQRIVKVPRSIGKLTFVRHLNLSRNPLFKLPNEITKMVNLLTLDLHFCYNLQKLPREMEKLVNLLSLNLLFCRNLKELPKDMGKLVKLRHLQVLGCEQLSHMPKGLGNLTELQTLGLFIVGEKSKGGAKLEELGHLKNLKGDLTIKLVEEFKYIVSKAGEAHLGMKTKLTELCIVFEKRAEEDEKFLDGIQLWGENLEVLRIWNYGGKRLPAWMTDDQFHKRFPKLKTLLLVRSNKLFTCYSESYGHEDEYMSFTIEGNEDDLVEWVPTYSRIKEQFKMGMIELSFKTRRSARQRLTHVRHLTLEKVSFRICKELAPRSSSGSRSNVLLKNCFHNLTNLELWEIPELEVVPEEFRDISSLEYMTIWDCPKLKAIPNWIDSLSSLKGLKIRKAPELKVLPDSIISLTSHFPCWSQDFKDSELLPYHVKNRSGSYYFEIIGCSKALFEKYVKPTVEHRPHLQHLINLGITSDEIEYEDDEFPSDTSPALIPDSSSDVAAPPLTLIPVPTHSSLLSLTNALFLFFLAVTVAVFAIYFA